MISLSLHLASRSFLWRQISPRVVPSHWSRDWNRNPLPSNGLSPLPRRLLAPAGVRASDRRLALRGAASLGVVRDEAPELLAGLTGAGALTSLPHSYRVRELHPNGGCDTARWSPVVVGRRFKPDSVVRLFGAPVSRERRAVHEDHHPRLCSVTYFTSEPFPCRLAGCEPNVTLCRLGSSWSVGYSLQC